MIEIKTSDLTEATLTGGGVFDVLMRATKAHLQEEYAKGRIKGPEYSQVYLGAMQAVMQQALMFALEKDKSAAQAALLREQQTTEVAQQGLIAEQTKQTAAEAALAERRMDLLEEEILLGHERVLLTREEIEVTKARLANIPLEGNLLVAQASKLGKDEQLVDGQIKKMAAEIKIANEQLKIAKIQGELTRQQTLNAEQERKSLIQQQERFREETLNITKQRDQISSQTGLIKQQEQNLIAERDALKLQPQVLSQQISNLQQENMLTEATRNKTCEEAAFIAAQREKVKEERCKLTAEYNLLTQKIATELAQTQGTGVDADSVVGRQKASLVAQTALYGAQKDGFERDAEQKATKIMVDSWNVRRTTDEGVQANATNRLDDQSVGRAVNRLLSGIGA